MTEMKVKGYTELVVWQRAMDLAESLYRATGDFPKDEIYGLRSQIRRAAVSVPSNIAEGQGRKSTAEFLHRLSIALGSLNELETQVHLGRRLAYMTEEAAADLLERAGEVGRLLNGLYNSLESVGGER